MNNQNKTDVLKNRILDDFEALDSVEKYYLLRRLVRQLSAVGKEEIIAGAFSGLDSERAARMVCRMEHHYGGYNYTDDAETALYTAMRCVRAVHHRGEYISDEEKGYLQEIVRYAVNSGADFQSKMRINLILFGLECNADDISDDPAAQQHINDVVKCRLRRSY